MFIRAYMRASTDQQDASRAKGALQSFAKDKGVKIASWHIENESGASLQRPELFKLLDACEDGDVLLIEQVDRLSRLTAADWQKLTTEIERRNVRVVALDLPTSWDCLTGDTDPESFQSRMCMAINKMLLDMLAAIARKDYTDRRRRQAEGIAKGQAAGRFKGRRPDAKRNALVADMLRKGMSWSQIQAATGCSRGTVGEAAKIVKAEAATPATT